jgi:hypothetical protein
MQMLPYEKSISKQQVQFVLGLLPTIINQKLEKNPEESFLGLKVLTSQETKLKKHITNLH